MIGSSYAALTETGENKVSGKRGAVADDDLSADFIVVADCAAMLECRILVGVAFLLARDERHGQSQDKNQQ